jgi:hypothetical protein
MLLLKGYVPMWKWKCVEIHVNYIWSDEKSQSKVDTIPAIIGVKIKINLSCEAFSEKLSANPLVLKKIHTSKKYV